MRNLLIPTLLTLLVVSSLPLHAESGSTQAQKQITSTTATHPKRYSAEAADQTKTSHKCAIYSGICPMRSRVKVGDYCICNTPSGPIHGVVIP